MVKAVREGVGGQDGRSGEGIRGEENASHMHNDDVFAVAGLAISSIGFMVADTQRFVRKHPEGGRHAYLLRVIDMEGGTLALLLRRAASIPRGDEWLTVIPDKRCTLHILYPYSSSLSRHNIDMIGWKVHLASTDTC